MTPHCLRHYCSTPVYNLREVLPSEPTHPFSNAEKPWSTSSPQHLADPNPSMDTSPVLLKTRSDIPVASTLRNIAFSEPCSYVHLDFPMRILPPLSCGTEYSRVRPVLRTEIAVSHSSGVPVDQSDVVDWCVSPLEEYGKNAGMEASRRW